MKLTRVLNIEDDHRLSRMITGYLDQNGCACVHAPDARAGFEALRMQAFDVILLDLMLPDADGLDICRSLRALGSNSEFTPIIMVTARGELSDRVAGLELGADDYLPKPFEPRELLARIRAVLRRAQADFPAAPPPSDVLAFGELEIDQGARRVRVAGQTRAVTSLQFDLLVCLARNAGRVLSRDQLRRGAGRDAIDTFDRSIDVHIGKIRLAIEKDPTLPERIVTVRNVGYVFARGDVAAAVAAVTE